VNTEEIEHGKPNSKKTKVDLQSRVSFPIKRRDIHIHRKYHQLPLMASEQFNGPMENIHPTNREHVQPNLLDLVLDCLDYIPKSELIMFI